MPYCVICGNWMECNTHCSDSCLTIKNSGNNHFASRAHVGFSLAVYFHLSTRPYRTWHRSACELRLECLDWRPFYIALIPTRVPNVVAVVHDSMEHSTDANDVGPRSSSAVAAQCWNSVSFNFSVSFIFLVQLLFINIMNDNTGCVFFLGGLQYNNNSDLTGVRWFHAQRFNTLFPPQALFGDSSGLISTLRD